ncbi:hypothetical protein T01_20 [Trichinella spiralis]|uniref:Uncharacterized protein n=1 Tax=Trichinella spiralis TaxID=6334 RepID=A0A0V1ASM8_TRISP|nr:hypothetical protein T01_20 [Trichinella spiralis]
MEAISVNYPGPFICQKCRHSEAVFARFVTHCTHHALKRKNRRVWTTTFLDCCQMWNGLQRNRMCFLLVEVALRCTRCICEKPLRSINSFASHYPHSVKASGRCERPSESSESSTVWYTVVLHVYCEVSEYVKLMNLDSASGLDGVKVSALREIVPHCLSKVTC